MAKDYLYKEGSSAGTEHLKPAGTKYQSDMWGDLDEFRHDPGVVKPKLKRVAELTQPQKIRFRVAKEPPYIAPQRRDIADEIFTPGQQRDLYPSVYKRAMQEIRGTKLDQPSFFQINPPMIRDSKSMQVSPITPEMRKKIRRQKPSPDLFEGRGLKDIQRYQQQYQQPGYFEDSAMQQINPFGYTPQASRTVSALTPEVRRQIEAGQQQAAPTEEAAPTPEAAPTMEAVVPRILPIAEKERPMLGDALLTNRDISDVDQYAQALRGRQVDTPEAYLARAQEAGVQPFGGDTAEAQFGRYLQKRQAQQTAQPRQPQMQQPRNIGELLDYLVNTYSTLAQNIPQTIAAKGRRREAEAERKERGVLADLGLSDARIRQIEQEMAESPLRRERQQALTDLSRAQAKRLEQEPELKLLELQQRATRETEKQRGREIETIMKRFQDARALNPELTFQKYVEQQQEYQDTLALNQRYPGYFFAKDPDTGQTMTDRDGNRIATPGGEPPVAGQQNIVRF